jgi:hypothetical protein
MEFALVLGRNSFCFHKQHSPTDLCNGGEVCFLGGKNYFQNTNFTRPVTVAERSNACTVFARSEAGIVGSNPTQGMDV